MPVSRCPLEERDRHYLERFLDVTKSQLFFARGVLLVEGISEALLLPLFAQELGYELDKKGIEVINIVGTSFAPFAKLFNSPDPNRRISARCAVITDDDSHVNGSVSDRATATRGLQGGQLYILLGRKTFEHELWEAGNGGLLSAAYTELHPRTSVISADDLLDKLASNRDKAEFAQSLARKLASDPTSLASLSVPSYITRALRWVAEGIIPSD